MSSATAIFPARALGELPADHVHVALAIGLPGHVFPREEAFPEAGRRPILATSARCHSAAVPPLRNCAGQPASRITGGAARTRVTRRRRRRRRPTGALPA